MSGPLAVRRAARAVALTVLAAACSSRSDPPQPQPAPAERAWSDGSTAGWGPEGGSGPNQLAYLRIAGQGCLYNVWSRLGRDHLEQLLSAIRFVDARAP